MTKFIAQAAPFAAAAIMTMAVFTGTSAAAGHQAHLAASAQADRQSVQQVAMQVQHVTIVAHRIPA
jgi:hypothetical protein